MDSTYCFSIATCIYLTSGVFFAVHLGSKAKKFEEAGNYFALLGFLIQTLGLLLRWKEPYGLIRVQTSNGIPYEMMIIFPWVIAIYFLIFCFKSKFSSTGLFVLPFAIICMTWAQFSRKCDIVPAWPHMESNWPAYYVFASSVAYAAFAIACSVSIMYIIRSKYENNGETKTSIFSSFPPTETLNTLNHQKIKIGFSCLTLSLIIGALWSNFAWGTFWSWAPLEVWSLFVWFVYAVLHYIRFTRKTDGVRASRQAIICLIISVLSYLVIQPLFRGLVCY